MSLFIGNISKLVTAKDLHEIFDKYGRCTVDVKGNFAFVDFEQARAAEQAKNALHNREIMGNVVNIEWSRKRKRGRGPQPSNTSKTASRGDIECYICRELGHMAKECKYQERDESGHKQEMDYSLILENIKRESGQVNIRVKSPDRYAKHMTLCFNILRGL